LGITFYKSIIKAVSTYQKEIDYLNNPNSDLTLIMIDGIGEYFNINKVKNENSNIEIEFNNIRKNNNYEMIEQDVVIDGIELMNRNDIENNSVKYIGDLRRHKYFNTFLMFLNTSIISVFSYTRKYFNVCNYLYWVHSFGQFLVCGLLGYYTINYLIDDYRNKKIIIIYLLMVI